MKICVFIPIGSRGWCDIDHLAEYMPSYDDLKIGRGAASRSCNGSDFACSRGSIAARLIDGPRDTGCTTSNRSTKTLTAASIAAVTRLLQLFARWRCYHAPGSCWSQRMR